MPLWTCEQCGAQFPESAAPPSSCPVCEDERQYVNWKGQNNGCRARHWRSATGSSGVTTSAFRASGRPGFAIGSARSSSLSRDGCVMWDCIPLATREAVDHVSSLGGLRSIAVSHPHYYGAVADWSEASAGCRSICMATIANGSCARTPASCRGPGQPQISDDIALVRTGGHFAGGTILHWRAGADGRGALLTGDIAMVAMDRRSLSFMYSFPNYIPLNARRRASRRAGGGAAGVRPHLGAWWGKNIEAGAKAAFDASVKSISRGDSD